MSKKFKVIIAGGRDFNNLSLMKMVCNKMLSKKDNNVEIVSGTANGADKMGEAYAYSRGFTVKRFPADWDGLGKRAGAVRNAEMAEYCDAAIIFWDGASKGTKNMIDNMKKIGKPHIVKKY
ncbi:GTP-binding domain [Maribacter phage Panino]